MLCTCASKGRKSSRSSMRSLFTWEFSKSMCCLTAMYALACKHRPLCSLSFLSRASRLKSNFYYTSLTSVKLIGFDIFVCCQGLINLDYESEVEDDILPIFRKGEVGKDISFMFNFLESFYILLLCF